MDISNYKKKKTTISFIAHSYQMCKKKQPISENYMSIEKKDYDNIHIYICLIRGMVEN